MLTAAVAPKPSRGQETAFRRPARATAALFESGRPRRTVDAAQVCGGGVTFTPDVDHEGVALTRGARRVVAIFTDECSEKAAPERDGAREAQRQAALQVFGRLKPPSRAAP